MSEINWQDVRADYESGQFSQSKLERKYGVSRKAIWKHATKENWDNTQVAGRRSQTSNHQKVINRDVNAAIKVQTAIKYRMQKMTYEEIAQRCGYANPGSARNAILNELQRNVVTEVEELRREESAILDKMHAEAWELMMDKENKARLFAMDRLLDISKDRRKLFNLDVRADDVLAGVTVIREYGVEVGRV